MIHIIISVKSLSEKRSPIYEKCFSFLNVKQIKDNELSIAFSLTFKDELRTLTDEEVMNIFNNIIKDVTTKHHAVLRDN